MVEVQEIIDYIKGCYYADDFNIDYTPDFDANGEEYLDVLLYVDTLRMSEDNYATFESICDKFSDKCDDLADCVYDVSGYHYWTELQEESNYAMVCIHVDKVKDESDLEKLQTAIDDLYVDLTDLYDIEP